MSTILTDDELKQMWDSYRAALPRWLCFARAVEAAVLAKLAQQEPVAHRYRFGDVWMFDTYRWNGQDADEVVPVYAHPAPLKDEHPPCMGTNCGKTRYDQEHSAECIAETAKSQGWDTHPAPQQADRQRVPLTDARIIEVLGDTKHSQITAVRALIAESHAAPEAPAQTDHQRVPANKAQNEFNRVIQHAITLRGEAAQFLRCWNEGNWDGCREFDFEPALPYEIEGQADRQRVTEAFTDWLCREMPPGTIISDPAWWSPKIARAMLAAAPEAPAQASAVDERDRKDAERYRWLRGQMLGVDFDWNENGITALCFEMPDGCSFGADCDQDIDEAMSATLAQKGGAA